MKKLKYLFMTLAALMIMAVSVDAQNSISFTRQVSDGDILIYYATDTVSSDTSLFEITGILDMKDWTYSVHMVADSVSGTAAATAYLQTCSDYTSSSCIWSTISSGSQSIDGAGRTTKIWEGTQWYQPRMRVRVAASGTCVNVVYLWVVFKKP